MSEKINYEVGTKKIHHTKTGRIFSIQEICQLLNSKDFQLQQLRKEKRDLYERINQLETQIFYYRNVIEG